MYGADATRRTFAPPTLPDGTDIAQAQCCCSSISLQLDLPHPAMRDTSMSYTVSPGPGPRTSVHITGDSLLFLTYNTGCGRSNITWTIRHKWSGQEMQVDLNSLWGDMHYPMIRRPLHERLVPL